MAMRTGKWKLLCEYDGSDAELYDLDADPIEKANIYDPSNEDHKCLWVGLELQLDTLLELEAMLASRESWEK